MAPDLGDTSLKAKRPRGRAAAAAEEEGQLPAPQGSPAAALAPVPHTEHGGTPREAPALPGLGRTGIWPGIQTQPPHLPP